jgi:hypothetical protein
LNEPSFGRAAKELGDTVAADTENSTVVQELELAALRAKPKFAARGAKIEKRREAGGRLNLSTVAV